MKSTITKLPYSPPKVVALGTLQALTKVDDDKADAGGADASRTAPKATSPTDS